MANTAAYRVVTGKDPLLTLLNDLGTSSGRKAKSQFVAEGLLLVQRAVEDRLPVESIVFTSDLFKNPGGAGFLELAAKAGIQCVSCSAGLLGKVTTSRPVPEIVAPIGFRFPDAIDTWTSQTRTILIAENINNPDNLGMTVRTADAAGAQEVVIAGADPFHKNCVRAAWCGWQAGNRLVHRSGQIHRLLEIQQGLCGERSVTGRLRTI